MTDFASPLAPKKAVMPSTWGGELRALLGLGIPMAAAQFAQFLIFTIDILMIGRLSPEDLAAAALGTAIYYMLWMLGAGPVMAVTPMVSQALGADQNDTRDARRSMRMVLWVIFMMTPVIMLSLTQTEALANRLGQNPDVARKAGAYVLVLGPGLAFAMATMALRNFLAALGKTTVPFILVMIVTLLNAGLNYVLIFGHFGAPRLELVGAGIASSLSYIIGFFLFVLYIKRDKRANSFELFQNFWRPDWPRFKDVIALGWPISLTTLFEGMLFNAAVIIVGIIGVAEQAAYQVGLNIVTMSFMLPWGLSMAGAVRMGLAKGASNAPAMQRVATTTIFAALCSILLLAACVAFMPHHITSFYLKADDPQNAEVIALIMGFLPFIAGLMFFDAVQVAANQLLRGLKDVRWPMLITGVSYWVIGFPIAFILALKTDIGANGVWYGLTLGLMTASILLSWRLYRQVR